MSTPNDHGVYPKGDAECIAWPGAKPYIHAEIYVLHVDGVWIGAKSYQLGGTDQRGGCGPLMKDCRYLGQPDHTDRHACIVEEARSLLRSMERSDCKVAPRIRAWCEGLINGPDQMDLFGAAA